MAWGHLAIDKPHLVYIILGGFTSLFMLCSSVIKERLYIGEATVATICGIIFGPHAANLIDPGTWGNTDQITLEFSRIVLVVQCFAVGVELPKFYMERHWRSVVFLLVPVMTFGWLITSLFIWALMGNRLNWLDSLTCAACVTATDPVLASSVVGKGKFAKRVPKHLRDLLSAESGCNDGMAFPFIYLALYLLKLRPDADKISLDWFCITILYECIFGAIYGVTIGYIARRAIRYAHEKDMIDRESFLVFYFVLALFCAGSGSLLGMDDLLIGFACGVGFSNDGWFLEKTEETHVSNVIDLLINLAFFVYFGTIIPWPQYNSDVLGTSPWRLVVIAILVLFFRRIPIMLALKPVIPDIKSWREALFAGHFGPIGVGAIYVAILARAEIETGGGTPLAHIPKPGFDHRNVIELVWPITTFLVITSIVVHGSSVAVFTLGKHINTLTISMSYTQGNEEGYSWMERLPRIQSRSKSSMSLQNADTDDDDLEDKLPTYPAAALPKNFLRRQKEDEGGRKRLKPAYRQRNWDSGVGPGGPISDSAISPRPRSEVLEEGKDMEKSESSTLAMKSEASPDSDEISPERSQTQGYDDRDVSPGGTEAVIRDGQGEVLEKVETNEDSRKERNEQVEEEVEKIMSHDNYAPDTSGQGEDSPRNIVKQATDKIQQEITENADGRRGSKWSVPERFRSLGSFKLPSRREDELALQAQKSRKQSNAPARAFRFGRTIVIEDEDGEVLKKFDIPSPEEKARKRQQSVTDPANRQIQRLQRVGNWLGLNQEQIEEAGQGTTEQGPREQGTTEQETGEASGTQAEPQGRRPSAVPGDDEDKFLRFRMDGNSRRLSKAEFIKQIQALDPKLRAEVVEDSDASDAVKKEVAGEAEKRPKAERKPSQQATSGEGGAALKKIKSNTLKPPEVKEESERTPRSSAEGEIPMHDVSQDLRFHASGPETAAQRRRRLASMPREDSDDDATTRVQRNQRTGGRGNTTSTAATSKQAASSSQKAPSPPKRTDPYEGETPAERRRREGALGVSKESPSPPKRTDSYEGETAAEKRRREGALGLSKQDSDSDEDETRPRQPPKNAVEQGEPSAGARAPGIRFADAPSRSTGPSIRWGVDRR